MLVLVQPCLQRMPEEMVLSHTMQATGVMTYTGPSEAEVVDHFEAGTGVSISATGEIAIGQPVATTDDVTFNKVTADLDGQVADCHI